MEYLKFPYNFHPSYWSYGFVFYQFEYAPINFNPKAISALKNSNVSNQYYQLETENYKTQKDINHELINGNDQKDFVFKKKELIQREKVN